MIAKHRWGTPISEEDLLSIAALDNNEYPIASEVFEDLRSESYIIPVGREKIKLDNSQFETLADVLYYECEWEPFHIKSRLKHYEGWKKHDWV
jgi:hypothetical protein